jgi:hypothetical protein
LIISSGPCAWAGSEGTNSTFFGNQAGAANGNDIYSNTFIGAFAGQVNTSGGANVFLGAGAGLDNTLGGGSTFLGYLAGAGTTVGSGNTYVGSAAGANNDDGGNNTAVGHTAGHDDVNGNYNVFLGFSAGYSETGSNKLYIDNCHSSGTCTLPFIYGEFDNHLLNINGVTNVAANNVAKSQMHFSLANADSGGFLTSVLENNFFMSSGARFDGTAGGWKQLSSDQQATIAGSGVLGYRIFTDSGHTVGSNFTPTVRLHIDYNGNLGLNQLAVANTPIQHSSGAHLTAGGVWTDASSREYKEHIAQLSADDAMRTFAALTPVTYNYKVDPQERYVGFIAEEVPELVARKDRKSLSPMDIVAVLTKVVQEKADTIDALARVVQEERTLVESQQQKLALFSSKLETLESEIRRLKGRDSK